MSFHGTKKSHFIQVQRQKFAVLMEQTLFLACFTKNNIPGLPRTDNI